MSIEVQKTNHLRLYFLSAVAVILGIFIYQDKKNSYLKSDYSVTSQHVKPSLDVSQPKLTETKTPPPPSEQFNIFEKKLWAQPSKLREAENIIEKSPPPQTNTPVKNDDLTPQVKLPYAYVGKIDESGQSGSIYISDKDKLIQISKDTILDSMFRVNSITESEIEFEHIPTGQKLVLRTKENS